MCAFDKIMKTVTNWVLITAKAEIEILMIERVKWWRLNVVWCVPCRRFYIKKMKVSPRPAEGGAVPGVVRVPKHSHHRGGRQLTRRSGREFALSYISLSNLLRMIYILQAFRQWPYISCYNSVEASETYFFKKFYNSILSLLYKRSKRIQMHMI